MEGITGAWEHQSFCLTEVVEHWRLLELVRPVCWHPVQLGLVMEILHYTHPPFSSHSTF